MDMQQIDKRKKALDKALEREGVTVPPVAMTEVIADWIYDGKGNVLDIAAVCKAKKLNQHRGETILTAIHNAGFGVSPIRNGYRFVAFGGIIIEDGEVNLMVREFMAGSEVVTTSQIINRLCELADGGVK